MQYEDDVQLQSPIEDAWAFDQPEPTNLIALWPHQQLPLMSDIVVAMERFLGHSVEVLDELDTDAPEIQWTAALKLPDSSGLKYPLMVWVEPARESPDDPPAAAGCTWVLGVETMLAGDDPLTSYHALVRTLAGSLPDVPALLDINTLVWRDRFELQREYFADPEVQPPAEMLWTIHAVQQQAQASSNPPLTWLHTHGLWRCGLPELEMLEVPAPDAPAAAMLLNDVCEMLLEQRPSQPHEVYEIGANLAVTFQPWEAVAPFIADGVPGGTADREGHHNRAHAGVRAVVCGTEPAGTYRKLWTWPQQVIRRLQSGDAALFMTQRAAERQALLAARHWGDFQRVFAASASGSGIKFLVKAVFEFNAGGESCREHLWLDVASINESDIEATLMNQPVGELPFKRGQRVTVASTQVTDWQVQTATATFGPDESQAMLEAMATDAAS